ncbi:hypothetical protein DY218_22680 [Streptomyces triticagri]|uniref:Serine protease n=1 Tax=Streptomyces triticagri TaxID=2293568 RepID=A0A372M1T9_9ACTN|nr:hypothetical protein [Streptomyces triticagri]RFU84465.1 hypothetical protein DY218_22680 [Streptomyces triticagri]
MRSIRPARAVSGTRARRGARRSGLAAAGAVLALAMTATACDSGDDKSDNADAKPEQSQPADQGKDQGKDTPEIPADIADRLKDRGIDVDKWKDGDWKNWDKDAWLREAKDFVNPVIEGLWKPDRMQKAKDPAKTVTAKDAAGDQGATDPIPDPVTAQQEKTPYHKHAAPVGKVFFDTPEGSAVCSGTVVKDKRNPGKSNLVWTAGHCVHAGKQGGWFRNIAFVPSYNDLGKSPAALQGATQQEVAPYGTYWADWASTSGEWIDGGAAAGIPGAPYDYAVLHVKPENGSKSLEETVGNALPVDFSTPSATEVSAMGAWGYPAAPPYNGVQMHKCIDRPSRLSLSPQKPTMYRIGCSMTGGSSGGGWFRQISKGKLALVSNTSIGPATSGWLAGPQLGPGAEQLYDSMSKKYGSQ